MWISKPTPVTTSSMTARQAVDGEVEADVESAALDPGEVVLDVGVFGHRAEHAEAERTFSTQRNDSSTEPIATALTTAWQAPAEEAVDRQRRARGNVGISQRCCIVSVFQTAHFVDVQASRGS